MSTAAVSTPRVGPGGRKTLRRSISGPETLKKAIEQAAADSGMSASGYLEVLFTAEFPDELPRLVLTSIAADGARREIPMGLLRGALGRNSDGHPLARSTYTMSHELCARLDRAAEQSELAVSPYFSRLLESAFPEGLPVYGEALFQFELAPALKEPAMA